MIEQIDELRINLREHPLLYRMYCVRMTQAMIEIWACIGETREDVDGPRMVQWVMWLENAETYVVYFFDGCIQAFAPLNDKTVDPAGDEATLHIEQIAEAFWVERYSALHVNRRGTETVH